MDISKIFLTSDTHFGHTNIIKYCKRPFISVDEHDKENAVNHIMDAIEAGMEEVEIGDNG